MPATIAPPSAPVATDPRVVAFCSPVGPEVFSGIVHGNQIWTPDPFDVESIHAEAREMFTHLLNRASSPELPTFGKSLLLLGEAGSGKTHLMRAFRAATHASGSGYCGYLQMRSRTDNYARYLLSNLISSLEQPYKPGLPETGLNRLARGLLDSLDMIPPADRQRLCDDLLEPDEAARLVHRFADMAVQYPRFRQIDVNVLRAILYTIPSDGRIRPRILNWLRCEDLNKYDRELIGDLVPRPQPEKPMETILDLGRLMSAVHGAALVLLVDQIDETLEFDRKDEDPGQQFRTAIGKLLEVCDQLPNAIIVIGCLEDLFSEGREKLPQAMLDRLERDPDSIRLSGKPTREQITQMVERRLDYFFDELDIFVDPDVPLFPLTQTDLDQWNGLQTRMILDRCLRHRQNCVAAGQIVSFASVPATSVSVSTDWESRWNDYLSSFQTAVVDDEPKLAELLAETIRHVSAEMPTGIHFGVDPDGRFVPVEIHFGNNVEKLLVAICDKSARGGGLKHQIEDVAKRAGEIPAVIVRSTAFPNSPSAAVSREIAKLTTPRGKGRKQVVENSDWRAMAAFRAFHAKHCAEPGFIYWQRSDRPLAELRAIQTILCLDRLLASAHQTPAEAPPAPSLPPAGLAKPVAISPPPSPLPPSHAPIRLGQSRGSLPFPVDFQSVEFCRHAAFLGGSGSGKTTAALTIIEQLLLAGVPAVLIDRKGDLARYADPNAWTTPEPDSARAARRSQGSVYLLLRILTGHCTLSGNLWSSRHGTPPASVPLCGLPTRHRPARRPSPPPQRDPQSTR